MAKIHYQRHKTGRIKGTAGRFIGVMADFEMPSYCWSHEYKRWILWDGPGRFSESGGGTEGGGTHYHGCRTVRAFRRRLREWSRYLPSGIRFRLVSRYRGYSVFGTTNSCVGQDPSLARNPYVASRLRKGE